VAVRKLNGITFGEENIHLLADVMSWAFRWLLKVRMAEVVGGRADKQRVGKSSGAAEEPNSGAVRLSASRPRSSIK